MVLTVDQLKELEIECKEPWTVYDSSKISNSTYISCCSRVQDSDYIFSSDDIKESKDVTSSFVVERSRQIFDSEFVYDSQQVFKGKNITQSTNVINSSYVVRSSSIMNAAVVTDSHYVSGFAEEGIKQIKNSAFITDCANLDHCLFCHNIRDGKYLLFNKPIDSDQFDMIMSQMKSILGGWQSKLTRNGKFWPSETIPLDYPVIQRNIAKQYEDLPDVFWRWVKTLPGYDPKVLYAITYQSELLQ